MSTTAIEKRPVIQVIKDSVAEFARRLPSGVDPDRWTMQLATVVQKNPDLADCEARSLLLAAYEAAELGVSLSPTLQLGYLIPYKGKAHFQISWRGLVQKAYESGCVRSFFAEVVFSNDKFERQYAPKRNLFHAPADGDRGEMIGAYALVEFKDGGIDWEYCDKALIERHRKHSRNSDSLMWRDFHEEAWRKTPIRILAKRLPLTNPGMEALAETVERDAQADLEPEPNGRIELEPDSVLLDNAQQKKRLGRISEEKTPTSPRSSPTPAETGPQIVQESRQRHNTRVTFQVGEKFTIVSGHTTYIVDELPKIGARWDKPAGVWKMPASRTDELVELCKSKDIPALEVLPDEPRETATEAETLWPKGEEANRARE